MLKHENTARHVQRGPVYILSLWNKGKMEFKGGFFTVEPQN